MRVFMSRLRSLAPSQPLLSAVRWSDWFK